MMDTVAAVLKSEEEIGTEAFNADISSRTGRTVARSKKAAFGGKVIAQVMVMLDEPVYSQRVRVPASLAGKVILHRRHTASIPGVDFFIRLDEDVLPHLETEQGLVVTVCRESANPGDIGLGTVFVGSRFPGEPDEDEAGTTTPEGHGIFYKWYPNDEARKTDAQLYSKTAPLATHLDVLLEPADYQALIHH
jgi:hypothetical protein